MDAQFETRPLIEREALRNLQIRQDSPSVVRLTVHLVTFITLVVILGSKIFSVVVSFPLAVILAWVWSGLFAPFHECTHQTAFRTKSLNTLGTWLTGIPFILAPSVYKTFHFEHHRYTQDVEKDPELLNDPRYLAWPTGLKNWLHMATGLGLMQLKLSPTIGFALKPESRWTDFAKWVNRAPNKRQLAVESRIILIFWILFTFACLFWLPGGAWLLFAAWFTHVFQTLWVASEHTGLPVDGNILRRTRTVSSSPFVRFWLWNMNYHAEHHAWPGIPWHQLPNAHQHVTSQLESWIPSYSGLHANIINKVNEPSCDPL